MIYAYFNDCLPRALPLKRYADALEQMAHGYKCLYDRFPKCDKVLGGIITDSEISQCFVDNHTITIKACINEIDDRDVRTLLIAWMLNYPETVYFQYVVDEDEILEEGYYLDFNGDRRNAINLVLAKKNGAFLLSLNLHAILGVNEVEVQGKTHNVFVANLYGNKEDNVDFIYKAVNDAHCRALDAEKQIDKILSKCEKHSVYETELSALSTVEKDAVLNTWRDAECKKLLSPFRPDNDVIKKTNGPAKQEKNIGPVYELRVRKPRELRVYFQYVDGTFFLLDLKDKTHQDMDIKNAFAKAKKMRNIK